MNEYLTWAHVDTMPQTITLDSSPASNPMFKASRSRTPSSGMNIYDSTQPDDMLYYGLNQASKIKLSSTPAQIMHLRHILAKLSVLVAVNHIKTQ